MISNTILGCTNLHNDVAITLQMEGRESTLPCNHPASTSAAPLDKALTAGAESAP